LANQADRSDGTAPAGAGSRTTGNHSAISRQSLHMRPPPARKTAGPRRGPAAKSQTQVRSEQDLKLGAEHDLRIAVGRQDAHRGGARHERGGGGANGASPN